MTHVKVFDGHQDILSKLAALGGVETAELFLQQTDFHMDRSKCQQGRWCGGFFALWVSSPDTGDDINQMMSADTYDIPLPAPLDENYALRSVMRQVAILFRLRSMGVLEVCTSSAQLKSVFGTDKLAAIVHLEGAEAIDSDFHALELLYAAGLRSLGPVWSRPTKFAHGVPFRFPSTPDIGDGLTPLGEELIRQCNRKRILIDLSHINSAGFFDVARISKSPLVATHSNAYGLCPHARNLTDEQLEAIRASGGMVGLNFACAFLRKDGKMNTDTNVERLLRHLDYLLEKLGEEGVGIGSDFDGAGVPDAIGSAAGLPVLVDAMLAHGFGQALVSKICHENWLSVVERTWQN
ncbi:MAG: dipeptidase [Granulosicoccus sp.]